MGPHVVILLSILQQQPQDTLRTTYGNPATRALVVRAAERHAARDSAVADYRARIRYRLSVALGKRRWARPATAAVEEQDAIVAWQRPNDLRVDVIGRRFRSRSERLQLSSTFDRPWFVPRGLGDSIRIFSDEFPATGALHPLGAGSEHAYHYDLVDSVALQVPGAARLKLYAVQVVPKAVGPALVAGRLWLDAETAEVVRFTFRYVGTGLWARPEEEDRRDSVSARRINSLINRIVTLDVDLEYGLQDGVHWMPFRQSIAGTIRIPVITDVVIPFQAITTFDDYEINTGRPITFALALPDSGDRTLREELRDSLRAERREGRTDSLRGWSYADRWPGGRFEVHRPSNDSLSRYSGWSDSLVIDNDPESDARIREAQASLAALAEELPDPLTGRRAFGVAYENLADALQYNRVQGVSLGAGFRVRVPGSSFTDLFGTGRYGFSDQRATGRLSVVRDAPGGRLALSGYRDLAEADPFSSGRTLANSVNALFTAHDYGDYYLATGGSLSLVTAVGVALDLTASLRAERHRSTVREAKSAVNDLLGGDGFFPANPPVADGDYALGSVRLAKLAGVRWMLSAEGIAGEGDVGGRAYGEARYTRGGARGLTLRMKAGIASPDVAPQLRFRLGGMHTVRGFEYASLTGESFWAAQLDVSPSRGTIRPVLFADVGGIGGGRDAPAGLDGRVLAGGGIGVSMYSPLLRTTLIRVDLSHPITPSEGGEWRFDLVFSPVR